VVVPKPSAAESRTALRRLVSRSRSTKKKATEAAASAPAINFSITLASRIRSPAVHRAPSIAAQRGIYSGVRRIG
jgi:hypothetical protein